MKHVLFQLKGRDIVVLLGALVEKSYSISTTELAKKLHMSRSEVHQSIKRAQICHLFDPITHKPRRSALVELLVHGLPYVFPARPGAMSEGVLTAHSAPPLSERIISSSGEKYVWPFKGGGEKGLMIAPLARSVPEIALAAPEMHQLLALVDALRVGRAREKEIAKQELSDRILKI